MAILQQIITLTQEQYNTLINNNSLTVGGKTYIYDENTLYMVPDMTVPAAQSDIKSGTLAYWIQNANYLPQEGEMIIYLPDANRPYSSIKVGDGENTVSTLPFINAGSADKVNHRLTFGNGTYVYDGTTDITVPVYTGANI